MIIVMDFHLVITSKGSRHAKSLFALSFKGYMFLVVTLNFRYVNTWRYDNVSNAFKWCCNGSLDFVVVVPGSIRCSCEREKIRNDIL